MSEKKPRCPRGHGLEILQGLIERETDECVLWPYATDRGYGKVKHNGCMQGTHVLSWMTTHAESIPKGMCICHTCDVRNCVNPRHLFMGTHQDNSTDMKNKKRMKFGAQHHNTILTPDAVREIRTLQGITGRQIAKMFGIGPTGVCLIRRRKTWKWLED
jgi:hypothetical protein